MTWKRRVTGGLLAVAGYMLSPLSWWNDAFVNLPLALVFAWIISVFCPQAFAVAVVVGYWLTNILGLMLLHLGARQVLTEQERKYSRKDLAKDVGISLLYTALIVALVKWGILKPIQSYFSGG